jgi:hypothetical protein
MARRPAEIKTDIALTRRHIEARAAAIQHELARRWWLPYALVASGVVLGIVLASMPVHRLLGTGARTVRTGLTVAGGLAAAQRFVRDRRRRAWAREMATSAMRTPVRMDR